MRIQFKQHDLDRLKKLEHLDETGTLTAEELEELETLEELQYANSVLIENLEEQELREKYRREVQFDKDFSNAIPYMDKIDPADDFSAGVTSKHTITNSKNRKLYDIS